MSLYIFFGVEMTDFFLTLLKEYGYWIVFLGAMIEGESVVLAACAAAAAGYLNIWLLVPIIFSGTLIADQLIYVFGTFYGPRTLTYLKTRFTRLHDPIDRGLQFLKKHEIIYILTFRFIYGLRIISPFIIGAQHVSFKRFSILNLIAAALWTAISCAAGYALGHFFKTMTHNIGFIIIGVLLLAFGLGFGIKRIKSWRQDKRIEK